MKNRTMAVKHAKARRLSAQERNWRANVSVALDYQYGVNGNKLSKAPKAYAINTEADKAIRLLNLKAEKHHSIIITKSWNE